MGSWHLKPTSLIGLLVNLILVPLYCCLLCQVIFLRAEISAESHRQRDWSHTGYLIQGRSISAAAAVSQTAAGEHQCRTCRSCCSCIKEHRLNFALCCGGFFFPSTTCEDEGRSGRLLHNSGRPPPHCGFACEKVGTFELLDRRLFIETVGRLNAAH